MNEIETIFQKSPSGKTWFRLQNSELPNRAMNFGDGLFETMVWENGQVRFFERHIQRLRGGMQILGLDSEAIDISELLEFLTVNYPNDRKRVRWNVYRAGSGKYTPETNDVFQILQLTEFTEAPIIKAKADVSDKVQLFPTLWSSFKTLNALPYILANQERKERRLDEIILLDYRGFVSEAGASNVFWEKDEVIYTPSLSCSCINGVSRQVILEHLDRNSMPYLEGEFKLSELQGASRVFVSNCSGVSYLGGFGSSKFSTIPLQFLKLIFD
ncbi:branched-subunit amino acid aminotransferase/4-amino-4-deoxychorismate lyase [Algoriphagus sp. 4150]|uniref:aminotransferase class IV n=1 Tax=Algoriphagus sp. 4150 TaxID=2817756 RepID=UPI00285D19E8|nr:aminotransferase class IV [Algoriphagus sp. 4150]MDR7130153.1 branched-subunit amino acid aminotransferase/4-amino-4-deoxychorismate lyase [Algoriphagus sp. 4150]